MTTKETVTTSTTKLDSSTQRGERLESLKIYSEEALSLLKKALEVQKTVSASQSNAFTSRHFVYSSEDEEGHNSSSSESEGEVAERLRKTNISDENKADADTSLVLNGPKVKLDERKHASSIRKHVNTLICSEFSIEEDQERCLALPMALLPSEVRKSRDSSTLCNAFLDLSQAMQAQPVIVIGLRSGRFACAIFQRSECIAHRVASRYTVRKGQGKAQSNQDSQRRAQSMGSQLRRAGQVKLQADVKATLASWKDVVDRACLVLLSIPKTMVSDFYESAAEVLPREDPRIRRIPLDLGRPTFESASLAYMILTTVDIRKPYIPIPESVKEETKHQTPTLASPEQEKQENSSPSKEQDLSIPLTTLHVACKNGDLEVVKDLLLSPEEFEINQLGGLDLMSPLHFAAESTANNVVGPTAAALVELLLKRGADPTQVDIRNRPPYFLASHDKVRDAFRIARAELGEHHCDWDAGKVGPPLTEADLQARRDKEAEKRRRKKARAKEKKAKEKAHADEAAKKAAEEAEKRKKEDEAKRVRDGLQPKSQKANVCDFCQTEVKGRKRSQMFKRLDYSYCSSECVQKHKRELMAKAALSRFG